jgi:hypothetical protein
LLFSPHSLLLIIQQHTQRRRPRKKMSEPFVGRRVEITGTSRADLNGKRGTAISFDTDKGRYRVRVRGSDMYLKPSNLLPVPETGAPSSFADVRDQAEQYADEFMSRLKDVLPPGFAPRDALFAIVGFALLWRTAGLVRAAAVLLVTVLVLFGGAREAYSRAGGGVKGARAGFDAAGTFAAKEVSRRAGRPITSKQAWVGLALLVVVAYQFGGGRKAAPRTYKPPRSAYEPSTGGSCSDAYRRGFDDATAGRPYSADTGDAYDDEPEEVGHEPSGGMGSALLSKGLPLFFFGKQVQQLGGSPWNPQVAQRNFMALDPMRKAMFGFLVLRLLGLSPI